MAMSLDCLLLLCCLTRLAVVDASGQPSNDTKVEHMNDCKELRAVTDAYALVAKSCANADSSANPSVLDAVCAPANPSVVDAVCAPQGHSKQWCKIILKFNQKIIELEAKSKRVTEIMSSKERDVQNMRDQLHDWNASLAEVEEETTDILDAIQSAATGGRRSFMGEEQFIEARLQGCKKEKAICPNVIVELEKAVKEAAQAGLATARQKDVMEEQVKELDELYKNLDRQQRDLGAKVTRAEVSRAEEGLDGEA